MEMMLAYPVVVNLTVVPSVENQCGKDTAISPVYIYRYFRRGGRDRWLSLGGIMLSITGTKALFADQSHFPVPSIQIASTTVVFPCLLFAYTGQAAYLIKNTCHVVDAFYSSIPVENQCGKIRVHVIFSDSIEMDSSNPLKYDTGVLKAISPVYIYRYFRRRRDRWLSSEIASTTVVFPCLLFAYSGQAAYLIKNTCHVVDAFYSSIPGSVNNVDFTSRKDPSLNNQRTGKTLAKIDDHIETYLNYNSHQQEPMQPHPAEWARILEVATQRRTEVLAPENLENMWAKGRNYKKKENRNVKAGAQKSMAKSSVTNTAMNLRKDMPIHSNMMSTKMEEKALVHLTLGLSLDTLTSHENRDGSQFTQHGSQELSFEGSRVGGEWENAGNLTLNENKGGIKRSNSTSALKALPDKKKAFTGDCGGSIISEFYSPESHRSADHAVKKVSDIILRGEGPYSPKLKCRVIGAYFEKLGSNSFAVYSIAVTDSENRTWFVKRRIFSSSTEDAFVHQRCIQLDKYLQDLLSIANVAEQHEVWDFLSASSKAWILWEFHENPGRYVGVFFLVASS
uniref:K+ potassium transporter integral membrane domain-containing protein n=1 Tax=Salix viminalis TaxID=40686 RepID=A0A6N2MW13_SALVM